MYLAAIAVGTIAMVTHSDMAARGIGQWSVRFELDEQLRENSRDWRNER